MKEIEYEPTFEKEEAEWEKKKIQKLSKIPTVRTFRADVEELIQEKGETKTSIALAEANRREARGEKRFPVEENGSSLKKMIFVLLVLFAFILGVGAYAIIGTRFTIPFLNSATSTTSLISNTETIEVQLTNSPREQIIADISIAFGKAHLPTGGKRVITFLTKDNNGSSHTATAQDFFTAAADEPLPTALSQSLDTPLAYQVYSSSTLEGIITITSRSYPNTFAAMLDWESNIAKDLTLILNPWYDRKMLKNLDGRTFHDQKIDGFDARILVDLDGKDVIAYAFADKKTLLIAQGRDALQSVLKDISQKKKN
jgi:hypothetical protein